MTREATSSPYHTDTRFLCSGRSPLEGDSGGGYVIDFRQVLGGRSFVIGVQVGHEPSNAPSAAQATGIRFSTSDWQAIHAVLAQNRTGDVTTDEPTNLVFGSDSGDVFAASFRADIILGRGGIDVLSDGDAPGAAAWANDRIYGGDGADVMSAGRGSDLLHGGDHRSYSGAARVSLVDDDADTVSYERADFAEKGIKLRILPVAEGNQTFAPGNDATVQEDFANAIFVHNQANSDVDTLISIEKVIGTAHSDVLYIKNLSARGLANAQGQGGLASFDMDESAEGIDGKTIMIDNWSQGKGGITLSNRPRMEIAECNLIR
jgi:hypothetical protein